MQRPPEAGSSFGPAFLLLDGPQRRALSAYYAFARQADDIADDTAAPAAEKRARLAAWRAGVEGLFSGEVPDTPLARDLAAAIAAFPLERGHFLLVLDGVESDIAPCQPRTMAELEGYMYRVASAVGLACLAVFGYRAPRAAMFAEKLGYAVQLTNILRDVAEDAAAGRAYLPAEDLERFDCVPADLGGSNYPPNFIELMKFEGDRAEALYAEALALAEPASARSLLPALAMARLYRGLLAKMAGRGWRVKESRVRLNRAEKGAALLRACLDYLKV
ncbi:MAG: phytoene/squalene synthase family protein [Elusimicrobiales bacterium]